MNGPTILLLGESNPYSRRPDDALLPWPENAAGDRLRRILGMTEDEYLAAFVRRNLLHTARWSAPAAREAARILIIELRPAAVIALGRKVTEACRGFLALPGSPGPFEIAVGKLPLLSLPHSSGRCLAWNEPGARERAHKALEDLKATRIAETNMYDCTPCPGCLSLYRWPTQAVHPEHPSSVLCDDCGLVEPIRPDNLRRPSLDEALRDGLGPGWSDHTPDRGPQ